MRSALFVVLLVVCSKLSAELHPDFLLPKALVLKSSGGESFPSDQDFHIALRDSNTAVIWVAKEGQYLCGAVCALEEENPDLCSILSSDCKTMAKWTSSPSKGDISPIASIPHREVDWELVSAPNSNDKWVIAGVHKKQDIPVNYLIKKGNQTLWISKEQALELSLEGKLEIAIP